MRCVIDVMTYPVVTIHDETPFKDVVRLIRKHGVSALPVLDRSGHLVGVVSEADLMLKREHAVNGTSRRRSPWRGGADRQDGAPFWIRRGKAQGVLARDLMTSPVVTVGPRDSVAKAARIMRENSVKRLPVTDAHGQLVGIVSRTDLLTDFLRPDDEIRVAIERVLTEPRPPIEEGQIHVVVENGVANLSGHVEFKSQIPRIVTMARTVDGVVDVESRLEHDIDDISHERPSALPWDRTRAGVGDSWRSPDA
jgi:CBS domain-containing protein